jgi:hypothetical protein
MTPTLLAVRIKKGTGFKNISDNGRNMRGCEEKVQSHLYGKGMGQTLRRLGYLYKKGIAYPAAQIRRNGESLYQQTDTLKRVIAKIDRL